MHAPTASRSRCWLVAGPLLLLLTLAFTPAGADGAPRAQASSKAPTARTAPAQKTPSVNNSKNKGKKATAGKKKGKKAKHHKKNKHHKKHGKSSGGSGGGLISQLRHDEARLSADLNRLRKLLR